MAGCVPDLKQGTIALRGERVGWRRSGNAETVQDPGFQEPGAGLRGRSYGISYSRSRSAGGRGEGGGSKRSDRLSDWEHGSFRSVLFPRSVSVVKLAPDVNVIKMAGFG